MQYLVKYHPVPVWMGRTANTQYFLFRATIRDEDESWEMAGFTLWASHGRWQEMVETYAEAHIEPGNGLVGDRVLRAEAIKQALPPADHRDIVEFVEKFSELCEERGDPLLESELLV